MNKNQFNIGFLKPYRWILMLIPIIFLFIYIGYELTQNRESQQLAEFNSLITEYFSPENEGKSFELYQQKKHEGSLEHQLMQRLIYLVKTKEYPKILEVSDSIQEYTEYQQFSNSFQYFLYYISAEAAYYTMDLDKSFDYHVKASKRVENKEILYAKQVQKLQEQLRNIALMVLDNKKESLQKLLFEYDLRKGNLSSLEHIYFQFGISDTYNELGDYEKSNKYAKMGLMQATKIDSALALVNFYAILSKSYYELGQVDSLEHIEKTVDHLFKTQKIDSLEYYTFWEYNVDHQVGRSSHEEIEALYQQVMAFFPMNCENLMANIRILKSHSLYYKNRKDTPSERKALLHQLDNLNSCDSKNDYYWKEKLSVYTRLSEIDLMNKNKQEYKIWMKKKKIMEEHEKDQLNLYGKVVRYLSQRDVSFAQNRLKYHKIKVNYGTKVNLLYGLFIIIVFISIVYIGYLVFRNKKFQKKLRKSIAIVKNQNETIRQQNIQVKKMADTLDESNTNLKNFSRVAAHDIKSPISSMHSALSYISTKYENELEEQDREIIHNLEKSTIDLTQMITDLLNNTNQK